MLQVDESKFKKLLQAINETNDDIYIKPFKRDMGNYFSWIICCRIPSSERLKKLWNEIVDSAAVYLQAELESLVERSNLYIIFFVDYEVPDDLRTLIEQDKYSSRKVILHETMPLSDAKLSDRIEKLLFTLEVFNSQLSEEEELENWIKDEDNLIYNLFLENSTKSQVPSELIERYLGIILEGETR